LAANRNLFFCWLGDGFWHRVLYHVLWPSTSGTCQYQKGLRMSGAGVYIVYLVSCLNQDWYVCSSWRAWKHNYNGDPPFFSD
jgi:hypothetical protein